MEHISLVAYMALNVFLTTELIVKIANNALGELKAQEIKSTTGTKCKKTYRA